MGNFWPAASDCGGLHIDILFETDATMIKKAEATHPRPEIQPRRARSMMVALTEGVRQSHVATSLRSASSSRPISGQPPGVML